MKKIFVCSPLRGDFDKNRTLAELYCRIVTLKGHLPIAPHVYFTRFLNDDVGAERRAGMNMGLHLLNSCYELWAFTDGPEEITEGMQEEIDEAHRIGIPVKYIMPVINGDYVMFESADICIYCRERLTHEQKFFSNGICPHCKMDSDRSVCNTKKMAFIKKEELTTWQKIKRIFKK
jgi:hypothetical protein